MVTIKDIAARLQVANSTVGRALADDPRISAAMKQKVAEAAKDMGYIANRSARMMRGVSSTLVGLVVPDIRNSFYYTTAHALSKCLQAEGFQLALSETNDDRQIELHQIKELASVGVAGIIIVPSARPHPDTIRLLKATPSIQLLRKLPSLGDQWFGLDDPQALYLAARHVVEQGHKRVAYIGGSDTLFTGAERLSGFRKGLEGGAAGQSIIEELGPPSSHEFGRAALRRVLEDPVPPTAVVAASVQITHGVLEEIHASGLRVPDQLSVVGFGDELAYRWWGPGLTTVALPVSELATSCGLWFLHQVKRKTLGHSPYSSISRPTLVVRGSCTAPPRPA